MTGILWILLGLFVLQARYESAARSVPSSRSGYRRRRRQFVEAGVLEVAMAAHRLGVLFLIGGFAAITSPFQTFTILAALVGFFLVIKGPSTSRWHDGAPPARPVVDDDHRRDHRDPAGIWAMGYTSHSAALLILWIGVGAIVRASPRSSGASGSAISPRR